jgi:UDP-GlcNAc:undecaprenyl-phosphate GlcNAc-1-phosphate transferase
VISVAIAFVMAFLVSMGLTPVVRRLALRVGAMDDPNRARKIHTQITPRMGGLAIAAGFYVPILFLILVQTEVASRFAAHGIKVVALLAGGIAILALGVRDDRKGADAKLKLAVQLPVAVILAMSGFSFSVIALPWGGEMDIGWLGVIITVVWIVGITNAVNLIDGLDGLAAGITALVACTLVVVSFERGMPVGALLNGALAGALIGFLMHNAHPATIFMGDTGSLFIGYIIAASALFTNSKSTTTVTLLVPVLALGLPIMDTTLATFRRLLRGRSPFSADQEHIHHRLLKAGLTHKRAVIVMWVAAAGACVGALGLVFTKGLVPVAILTAYGVMALVLVRRLGYVRVERWRGEYREGREAKLSLSDRQSRIRAVVSAMPLVRSHEELCGLLIANHGAHRYGRVQITIPAEGRSKAWDMQWVRPEIGDDADPVGVSIGFDLPFGEGASIGRIEYFYPDTVKGLDVDDEMLFGMLHNALGEILGRLSGRSQPSERHLELLR